MHKDRDAVLPQAADVVVFGAPGASLVDGKICISDAGRERARLAAWYWLSCDQGREKVRVICVAGRPKYRSGMLQLPAGESEAAAMIEIMRGLGVPDDVIRPNERFPLQHDYAISTVDEVAILVEEGLIAPEFYDPRSPLGIVVHRRHGARAVDVLCKVGFDPRQLRLVSPPAVDPYSEVIIRSVYRAFVLGGRRTVSPTVLRYREQRLVAVRQQIRLNRGVGRQNGSPG